MSKFTEKTKGSNITVNHEGEKAYKLTPAIELYSLVVTSLVEDKFYESTSDQMRRLNSLIKKVDPLFVAKLAVYAREKMYLRSIPVVLMVELAKQVSGKSFISTAVNRIIQRVDEITEILSYYAIANNRKDTKKLGKLSKQIQKGISAAFNRFDEYQFAKYNRAGSVTLKDALFLTHPKAKDDNQQKLFDKIVNDNLKVPYTWETQLSTKGNTAEVWKELIDSGKFPYMALLRNLRNILKSGVTNTYIKKVADIIGDKKRVLKSKQFPFRFYSAYKFIEGETNSSLLLDALEEAIAHSVENITFFDLDENILIACDVSGSMYDKISSKSTIRQYDIGLILGMLLKNKLSNNVITGIFGDTWKVKNFPKNNIISNVRALDRIEGEVGYATYGYKVIEWLNSQTTKVDKIFIFTDCQMWSSHSTNDTFHIEWTKYKSKNKNARLYLFDLSGYGNTPVNVQSNGVYLISGWSDKIFDMINAIENKASIIKEIDKIDL